MPDKKKDDAQAIRLELSDESATQRLGQDIAAVLKKGICLHLVGDLGAGKTTLARSIIRALCGAPDLAIPSPTYTLIETYQAVSVTCGHADLYRLSDPEEVLDLGLEEVLHDGLLLIEWPDKGAGLTPKANLRISLSGDFPRQASLDGDAALVAELERSLAIRHFLDAAGWPDAWRQPLKGDASKRTYETIINTETAHTAILMNAPEEDRALPDDGEKGYAERVHLALDVGPFVAIDQILRKNGFRAPQIYDADLDQGLLLLESLGAQGVVEEGKPVAERYLASAELLAEIHQIAWPVAIDYAPGRRHTIEAFDGEILTTEASLLLDWYLTHETRCPATAPARNDFQAIWQDLAQDLAAGPKTLVLRDFHSPNILWQGRKKGRSGPVDQRETERIGLIDFQDALIGSPAYDLASLGQDARVTIEPDLEASILTAYVASCARLNAANGRRFDEAQLRRHYAILAAQRAIKILGIFARLSYRDGKRSYMQHIPRLKLYLQRTLIDPRLARLKIWCQEHKVIP